MSWDNENGKHFGLVCATCDKMLGRKHLVKAGMSVQDAILFERYLAQTVDLMAYPDWPQWLEQYINEHGRSDGEELRELNLPPRTFNALYRLQITLDQLVVMSTKELMKIRWIGKDGVTAIQKALEEHELG